MLQQITENLYRLEDTCNVYVIRSGTEAVAVDFGSGSIVDEVAAAGIERITDVLMTHHHRDQGQGLPRAAECGARIWVPHSEWELFGDVERAWQRRQLANNYNTREDRFAIAASVPVAGTFQEYVPARFGDVTVTPIPLPGHTIGSVGFLVEVDGRRVAFTGDLIAGPGKVWSLAATQWAYGSGQGLAMSWLSLMDLRERGVDLLAPSHGPVMDDPVGAIDLTASRLRELLDLRGEHPKLEERRTDPYERVLPHLLYNRAAHSQNYALLSDSGKALLIDYGYDLQAGLPAGTDRAARRPWLYTLPALRKRFGVQTIDAVVPTHYHDDHVAGCNLVRAVEGTEVWAPANFANVLRDPSAHDLPCLWYDPIEPDRELPLGEPIRWEEHELVLHPLPGHTRYAVAIEVTVDGVRALFTGDQTDGDARLNYIYRNRFSVEDYRTSGDLYARLSPDVLMTGHWGPIWTDGGVLERIRSRGYELERLHRELLPLEELDLDAEGFAAWIRPYQSEVFAAEPIEYEVEVRNPLPEATEMEVGLVVPSGWYVDPVADAIRLQPGEHGLVEFKVEAPLGASGGRSVITADIRAGGRHLGEHAEAVVVVNPRW
ncbi:MAG: MBL fold metallo-hydrolase [Actinomycetota bacterium]